MKSYLALVESGDDRHAYGIQFPDLPGVFSASDSKDDVITNAIEALRLWAEDEELPEPSDHAAITRRTDVQEHLRNGWYLVEVPLIESDNKVVRANVTFERGVLDAIDTTAKSLGMTRSSFLSVAAQSKIERSVKPWMYGKGKVAAKPFAKAAAAKLAVKAAAAKKPAVRAASKPGGKTSTRAMMKATGRKPTKA